MFKTAAEQNKYITENYPDVSDARMDEDHWDLTCTRCKVTRGFQVIERVHSAIRTQYQRAPKIDLLAPITYYFRCPVRKAYKQWIVYRIEFQKRATTEGEIPQTFYRYFRVASLPSEGVEEIEELPENPAALRTAYRQAIRAMDANANLAAAAMFRRALQVITRDFLGAKPGNLANELREVVGKSHNGAVVTANFSDVGYIVKEAGNQGAHPDSDPDLLDFTSQDAADLQNIFMQLVSELFIVPRAIARAKAEFLARRKIEPKK